MKANLKLTKRIHQLGDEYIYVYKYKVLKFKRDKLYDVVQYSDPLSASTWHIGRVVWEASI